MLQELPHVLQSIDTKKLPKEMWVVKSQLSTFQSATCRAWVGHDKVAKSGIHFNRNRMDQVHMIR